MQKTLYMVISGVIASLFCVQVTPSYAMLEEIGAGLDKLGGFIQQELSSDQEGTISIEGDDNEVNLYQESKPEYELTNDNEPEIYDASDEETAYENGDLTIKVNLEGNCDDAKVGVKQTGVTKEGQCGETITFFGQNIQEGEEFEVCAKSNGDKDCETGVNGEENEPERVTLNL